MKKDKQETQNGLPEIGVGLDGLVRHGARQVIQQAIVAELAELLAQYADVKTLTGRQAIVRNGYLPERDIVTAAGPVTVEVPKVGDRSGTGVKFNSSVVLPYIRKSPRVSAALPRCTSKVFPPVTWATHCRCCCAKMLAAYRRTWCHA